MLTHDMPNINVSIHTLSCPSKSNSNTIELTVHTSFYWGPRLTLCLIHTHILCAKQSCITNLFVLVLVLIFLSNVSLCSLVLDILMRENSGSIQQTFSKKFTSLYLTLNFFPKNSTKGMPLIQSISEDNMPFFSE